MILLLTFFAQVTLAQQTRSFSFDLPADVSHATPLLVPSESESGRLTGHHSFCILRPLHSAKGRSSRRPVTAVPGYGLTVYDPAAGRVGYLVTDPGFLVTEIAISIVPAGALASRATVTYRRSALTERANEQVRAMTTDWAAEQAHHWGAAIGAALKRSGGRE